VDRSNQVVENPFWLSLGEGAFDAGNVMTANLQNMLFAISGAVLPVRDVGLTYAPLIQSSTQCMLINRNKVRQGPDEARKNFVPTDKKLDIAVLLTGVFPSAFPDGPPEGPAEAGAEKPHLNKGVKASSVIIIADVDMISDGNYVEHKTYLGQQVSEPFNDNLNFILNAGEILTGNKELANIRSRGKYARPFTKVVAMEKEAQIKWMAQEQELVKKFEDTKAKLDRLERQKDASQKFVVSEAQEAEMEKFKKEKQDITKKLKEVRRSLTADIDQLGLKIKFINIFLMPLLVSIIGVAYAVHRRNKAAAHKNMRP
jgi:ABC-type uncharacterized transport system involved in gliding motility auxiliary subunit